MIKGTAFAVLSAVLGLAHLAGCAKASKDATVETTGATTSLPATATALATGAIAPSVTVASIRNEGAANAAPKKIVAPVNARGVCQPGQPCNLTCSKAGGCAQACAAGGQCNFTCTSGSCTQSCAQGAVCNFTCEGGSCKQSCAGGAPCLKTCEGGNCS